MFVHGIKETEHERDGNCIDPGRFQGCDQFIDFAFGKRCDDLAVRTDTFTDFKSATTWDQRGWCVLEQIVEVRTRRAPKLQDIAEAARRNQRRTRPLLLKDGIGHDSGRVREETHLGVDHIVAAHC